MFVIEIFPRYFTASLSLLPLPRSVISKTMRRRENKFCQLINNNSGLIVDSLNANEMFFYFLGDFFR